MRDRVRNSSRQEFERYWRVRLNPTERESLRELCAAKDAASRHRGLEWIELMVHSQAFARDAKAAELAAELLESIANESRGAVRARALGVMRAMIGPWHEKVWAAAWRMAHSRKRTLAELVPSFLLEHLLEHQFEVYYPKVRDALEAGDQRMAEMLDGGYVMGQAEPHEDELAALLRKHGIEPRFASGPPAETVAGSPDRRKCGRRCQTTDQDRG
jgi:hypothetical protein